MNQIKLTQVHALWAIVTLILTASVVAALILPEGVWAQLNTNRVGYDALSAEEQANVLASIKKSAELGDTARSATTEFLWVERHQEEKAVYESGQWPRRAASYLYDYSTDTLITAIINTKTSEVDSIERVQNVQPLLNEREVQRALEIAWADPVVQQLLKEQYQRTTNTDLETIDQLRTKAFVFRADSMPDTINEQSQLCGLHRCAQLLLYTQDDTAFEFLPIIDLSKGIIVQAVPFVDAAAPTTDPTPHTTGGQDEH